MLRLPQWMPRSSAAKWLSCSPSVCRCIPLRKPSRRRADAAVSETRFSWRCTFKEEEQNPKHSTYCKGARTISGRSPASAAVEAHSLIRDNPENASTPEGFGICLALDFENIEGKEDNLSNANQTSKQQSGSSPQVSSPFVLTSRQSRA